MKRLLLVAATLALGACTVMADVPSRVIIESDKVTIHRDHDRYEHAHKHPGKPKNNPKNKHKKHKPCPYGQAKKGHCYY